MALISFARKVVVINPVEWVSHIEERSAIGDVQASGVVVLMSTKTHFV